MADMHEGISFDSHAALEEPKTKPKSTPSTLIEKHRPTGLMDLGFGSLLVQNCREDQSSRAIILD